MREPAAARRSAFSFGMREEVRSARGAVAAGGSAEEGLAGGPGVTL